MYTDIETKTLQELIDRLAVIMPVVNDQILMVNKLTKTILKKVEEIEHG